MLIRDLLDSNVNALIGELRVKLSKLQAVAQNARTGGDYQHTVSAQIEVTKAAIAAAEMTHATIIEADAMLAARTEGE